MNIFSVIARKVSKQRSKRYLQYRMKRYDYIRFNILEFVGPERDGSFISCSAFCLFGEESVFFFFLLSHIFFIFVQHQLSISDAVGEEGRRHDLHRVFLHYVLSAPLHSHLHHTPTHGTFIFSFSCFSQISAFNGASLTAAKPASSAMKMSFESEIGAQAPIGFWDPLGLLTKDPSQACGTGRIVVFPFSRPASFWKHEFARLLYRVTFVCLFEETYDRM